MKKEFDRTMPFTEEMVEEWCEQAGDPNPIHTDEEEAARSMFGRRVVPGMMLLDQLSGMLTNLGEDDETVILAGVTAARFRDPVVLDEVVQFHVEVGDEDADYVPVHFEVRSSDRNDKLVAHGTISIVVK